MVDAEEAVEGYRAAQETHGGQEEREEDTITITYRVVCTKNWNESFFTRKRKTLDKLHIVISFNIYFYASAGANSNSPYEIKKSF